MLIIDEVSMMDPSMLAKVSTQLQKALGLRTDFGGLDSVLLCGTSFSITRLQINFESEFKMLFSFFAGDYAQLPPTGGDPLYTSKTAVDVSQGSVHSIGKQLYHSFDKVIVLQANMRAASDHAYRDLLGRGRTGEWLESDYDYLQGRLLSNAPLDDIQRIRALLAAGHRIPIITTMNKRRVQLNNRCVLEAALRGRVVIRLIARFTAVSSQTEIDMDIVDYLLEMTDNQCGGMQPFLDLYLGCAVMITQNLSTENGVCNGTTGVVVGCIFADGTTFSFASLASAEPNVSCQIPSKQVVAVLVKIDGGLKVQIDHLPVGFQNCDVYPVTCKELKVTRKVSKDFSLSAMMSQLPLRLQTSMTVHKVQGLTLPAVIVDRLCGAQYRNAMYYVVRID